MLDKGSGPLLPAWMIVLLVVSLAARVGVKLSRESIATPESGIQWQSANAVSFAQKHLLFIDFTDENSRPCLDMQKTTFLNNDIISMLKENFNCVKVVDGPTEDKHSQSLKSRYDIKILPSLVVALPDGSEIGRHVGYLNARQLTRLLTEAVEKAEFARAQSLMIKGQFSEAEHHLPPLSDIDWTLLGPKHTAMLYWNILMSCGKKDEATRVIDKAENYALRNAAGYVFDQWPRQNFQYMRGERSDGEFTHLSSKHSKDDYSDALCMVALKQMQMREKERAKYEFLSVVKAGCTHTFSYNLAQSYLSELAQDKVNK